MAELYCEVTIGYNPRREPADVTAIVLTHAHLDAAGAAGALAAACPNACIHAHPRACRHLADPVRARPGRRLSALSVSHRKSLLYGAFVWARRALNSPNRRFLARVGSRGCCGGHGRCTAPPPPTHSSGPPRPRR